MAHTGATISRSEQYRPWVISVGLTGHRPLPVYPDQRTSSDRAGWSGWCPLHLFGHLVGDGKEGWWDRQAQCFGSLEVYV